MKHDQLTAFGERFDRLPNAGTDEYAFEDGTSLRAQHVGNIVTVQLTSPWDGDAVRAIDKFLKKEYYVELANTGVGFWELRAEAA